MTNNKLTTDDIKKVTLDLLAYCQEEKWAGWDPYDGLNSRLFQLFPFLNHRIPRLVMIQAMKRIPINLRHLLLVPKTQNPKALALFLSSLVNLYKFGLAKSETVLELIERIKTLRSPNTSYWCWGYSFPWQTRFLLVPKGEPNLVCTTFVANALLDTYETGLGSQCLKMAKSAAEYIQKELYWTAENSTACFCYPTPSSKTCVHNANFLAAALLCRVYHHTKNLSFLEPALNVCRYSASKQEKDGAWFYGEHSTQQWIDNFHTGYNLCALSEIVTYTKNLEFLPNIQKGLYFYLNNFFTPEGAPKYFHNRLYPIDIHSSAQSIITLLSLKDFDDRCLKISNAVLIWTLKNMYCKSGYFYCQILTFGKNKIPYIRWSEAWMLFALSFFLVVCRNPVPKGEVAKVDLAK